MNYRESNSVDVNINLYHVVLLQLRYFQVYNKLTAKFNVSTKLYFERNGAVNGFTISVFYP